MAAAVVAVWLVATRPPARPTGFTAITTGTITPAPDAYTLSYTATSSPTTAPRARRGSGRAPRSQVETGFYGGTAPGEATDETYSPTP